jgi:hypothetical protein
MILTMKGALIEMYNTLAICTYTHVSGSQRREHTLQIGGGVNFLFIALKIPVNKRIDIKSNCHFVYVGCV